MAVFDKEANYYDEWYETKMGYYVDKVETECALNLFKVKKGMKILDVGCGTGNFSIKLARMGCKVVGIDISEEMLEVAKEKAEKEDLDIEFYNMDVYDLKFENEIFDGVFSMAAFEFIEKPEIALGEIFRVVKKDEYILIGTINKDSKWGELYLSEDFQESTVFKYANFKTIEDLKSWKEDKLIDIDICLFIPPNAAEEDISMEKELELSKTEKGGFLCALWQK